MEIKDRLRAFILGWTSSEPLATRHERREAARQRHHKTGEPLWAAADRHLGPGGERLVADVTPGTPGHDGSVHTTRDV
ncbi:MAG: hypothetical protein ABJC39_02300 [Chloroflexota bacterium]